MINMKLSVVNLNRMHNLINILETQDVDKGYKSYYKDVIDLLKALTRARYGGTNELVLTNTLNNKHLYYLIEALMIALKY